MQDKVAQQSNGDLPQRRAVILSSICREMSSSLVLAANIRAAGAAASHGHVRLARLRSGGERLPAIQTCATWSSSNMEMASTLQDRNLPCLMDTADHEGRQRGFVAVLQDNDLEREVQKSRAHGEHTAQQSWRWFLSCG